MGEQMDPVLGILLAAVLGALIGGLTGLIPSLHVNTLAVLLIMLVPLMPGPLAWLGLDHFEPTLYAAVLILSISVSHTFVTIIPAAYLGAPDEATALSVLPAHRLLLQGQGFHAVRLSGLASFAALAVSLLLLLPFKWVLAGPPEVFESVRRRLGPIILILAILILLGERHGVGPEHWPKRIRRITGQLAGALLFLTAGLYGLTIFQLPHRGLVDLPEAPLLPALSGLFGAATILTSLIATARLPHQFVRIKTHRLRPAAATGSLLIGVTAGATMSVLPGLTSASATGLISGLNRRSETLAIISLSAVNTANAMFNLAMLALFGKTRSGAVVAIDAIAPMTTWIDVAPQDLVLLLMAALAAGYISLLLTLGLGRLLVRRLQRIPYKTLLIGVLVYMTLSVILFTGPIGLLSFATATALGVIPARLGLRRVSLTGVLLVPVLTYVWT
jgi:putative membrane protein